MALTPYWNPVFGWAQSPVPAPERGSSWAWLRSPLGQSLIAAGLGWLAGLAFPNAFAEPGSGWRQYVLERALDELQRAGRVNQLALLALGRVPPAPSIYWRAQQRARAESKRAGESSARSLPVGVSLPGLRERVESAVYANLSRTLDDILRGEAQDPIERALRQIQMLQAVGGQSRDLAQSYGYLAQLWGQMGNSWVGMLPQLLAGLTLESLRRRE